MEIADTRSDARQPAGRRVRIEPVTASARSRLGQRVTFVVQDETHSWVQSNGGLALADNQRRNLGGHEGPVPRDDERVRSGRGRVAQRTFESKAPGTLIDDRGAAAGSIRNKRERRKVLQHVYGDSWWVDLDRIDQEIEALLEHDPAQAERFFLNRKLASEGAAFDIEKYKALRQAPKRSVDGHHVRGLTAPVTTMRSLLSRRTSSRGISGRLIIIERPRTRRGLRARP
jgi:hypothetical protein